MRKQKKRNKEIKKKKISLSAEREPAFEDFWRSQSGSILALETDYLMKTLHFCRKTRTSCRQQVDTSSTNPKREVSEADNNRWRWSQPPPLVSMGSPSFDRLIIIDHSYRKEHVILSRMVITLTLTRASCIRLCRSHHHRRHCDTHTQTQSERITSVQLARFSLLKPDCICREGNELCRCLHYAWPMAQDDPRSWNERQC
jgi:hypothetical protein